VKQRAINLGLCVAVVTFALSFTFSTTGTAIPDSVETFAYEMGTMPVSVFANGSMVFVVASDGASFGGIAIANVTDETFGDYILVNLYDDGTGPGDDPNDGVYKGSFTLVDDLGVNGQFTDNVTDILDLMDGAIASISVDIDLQMDPGFATIRGDFSPPDVRINSLSDLVDKVYTLNATITDPNMDTSNVWFNVDGGANRRLTYRGGNEYERRFDTSTLLDGPHTIRVVAFDIVLNQDSTMTVTIYVHHPVPDISILVIHVPGDPKEGDRVTFTVEIENAGDAHAEDVTVSLMVDGIEVDSRIETIPADGTSTVELDWIATEGQHDIEVQLSGTGVNVDSPLELFDVQPSSVDLLENPLFMTALVIIFALALIGGTVVYARTARDLARATTHKPLPVEQVAVALPGEIDPCEEARRKWKAIQAEHERATGEMDSARRRADRLRNDANRSRDESDRINGEADEANEGYGKERKAFEDLKQKMHDFLDNGVAGVGISVGYPKDGQKNHIDFFNGVVKVFYRSPWQERNIAQFLDENSESLDEMAEEYEDSERGLMDLKMEVASVNRKAMEAKARSEAADKRAQQAEWEHESLQYEVESLRDRAEAFRQKWRICMLKRLDEAVDRAESASVKAAEAARRAKKAKDAEEFKKTKEDAQAAEEEVGQAKEDSKGIEQKLEEEGLEEDTSEQEERIARAENDASSAAKEVFALGAKFFQDQM
jgi:hypothetical protein